MEKRLPGNSKISFRFIEGLLLNFNLKGICASSGSACTSGSFNSSHVLLANSQSRRNNIRNSYRII